MLSGECQPVIQSNKSSGQSDLKRAALALDGHKTSLQKGNIFVVLCVLVDGSAMKIRTRYHHDRSHYIHSKEWIKSGCGCEDEQDVLVGSD